LIEIDKIKHKIKSKDVIKEYIQQRYKDEYTFNCDRINDICDRLHDKDAIIQYIIFLLIINSYPKISITKYSDNVYEIESKSGKDVASESGKDVASESGKDVASESGKDVASESGKDVASESGKDVASESGKDDDTKNKNIEINRKCLIYLLLNDIQFPFPFINQEDEEYNDPNIF
jgi:hypothetical protein